MTPSVSSVRAIGFRKNPHRALARQRSNRICRTKRVQARFVGHWRETQDIRRQRPRRFNMLDFVCFCLLWLALAFACFCFLWLASVGFCLLCLVVAFLVSFCFQSWAFQFLCISYIWPLAVRTPRPPRVSEQRSLGAASLGTSWIQYLKKETGGSRNIFKHTNPRHWERARKTRLEKLFCAQAP